MHCHFLSAVCRSNAFDLLPARERCNPVNYCDQPRSTIIHILQEDDRRTQAAGGLIAQWHPYCRNYASGTRSPQLAAERYCEIGHRRERAIRYCDCMTSKGVAENDWLVTVEVSVA